MWLFLPLISIFHCILKREFCWCAGCAYFESIANCVVCVNGQPGHVWFDLHIQPKPMMFVVQTHNWSGIENVKYSEMARNYYILQTLTNNCISLRVRFFLLRWIATFSWRVNFIIRPSVCVCGCATCSWPSIYASQSPQITHFGVCGMHWALANTHTHRHLGIVVNHGWSGGTTTAN